MRTCKSLIFLVPLYLCAAGLMFGQMPDRLGRTSASDLGALISSMMPVSIGESVVDSMGNLYLFDNTFTQGTGRTYSVKTKITIIPPTAKGNEAFVNKTFDGAFSSLSVGNNAVYAIRAVTVAAGNNTNYSLSLVAIPIGFDKLTSLPSMDLTTRTEIKVYPGSTDRIYLFQNGQGTMGAISFPGRSVKLTSFGNGKFGAVTPITLP
jgi:hypothetical protein